MFSGSASNGKNRTSVTSVAFGRELSGPFADQKRDRKGLHLVAVRIRHAEPWVGINTKQLSALDREARFFVNLPGERVEHRVAHIDDARRKAPVPVSDRR